jgi:hypothetical protein
MISELISDYSSSCTYMLYCVIQKTEFMLFSIMLFASPLLVLAYLYIHVEFIYLILRYFYNCALKCWIQINVCAASCTVAGSTEIHLPPAWLSIHVCM